MFGFAKSERESIDDEQLLGLKNAARVYLGLSSIALDEAVEQGSITELQNDAENQILQQDF